jgi:hypothetical protein
MLMLFGLFNIIFYTATKITIRNCQRVDTESGSMPCILCNFTGAYELSPIRLLHASRWIVYSFNL